MVSRVKDDRENCCYMCGLETHTDVHHIFGGSKRQQCDKDKLIVHLCRICHSEIHSSKGKKKMDFLHQLGQTIFEDDIGTRDEFINKYIKSYL